MHGEIRENGNGEGGVDGHIFLERYLEDLCDHVEVLRQDPLTGDERGVLERLVSQSLEDDVEVLLKDHTRRVITPHTLLSFLDWMEMEEPIMTGQGAMFRPPSQHHAIIVDFIEHLGEQRAVAKREMFKALEEYGKDSTEYRTSNNKQLTYKLLANSAYGVFAETGFHFYESTVAPSITYTGRLVITMMLYGFECFLRGNAWLESQEEVWQLCASALVEGNDINLKGASWDECRYLVEEALERACGGVPEDEREAMVRKAMGMLEKNDPNLVVASLAYRGDPCFALDLIPNAKNIFREIISNDSIILANGTQKDIDALPRRMGKVVMEAMHLLDEIVSPVWVPPDLTHRTDRMLRKGVIHTDTDSTFLSLQPWIDWIWEGWDEEITTARRFKAINIMLYFLRTFSRGWMNLFARIFNVPEDKMEILEFKSELVISRMFLTSGKKHYGSWITHQEGVAVGGGGYADFKGLAMKKTNVPESTGVRLQEMVERNILSGTIDRARMIGEIESFITEIVDEVSKGSTKYASPATVNDQRHYKSPWSITSVRGRRAWDSAFPGMEMQIGDRIGLYRLVVGESPARMDEVLISQEGDGSFVEAFEGAGGIRERWMRDFFADNVPREIRRNGLNWLAIPKDMDTLPEWIIPLIDMDSIIQSNLSAILPILPVLGLSSVPSTRVGDIPSNIVEV